MKGVEVLRRALIAGIAAILLVVAVAIPALAMTTQSWEERRIATEAFDAAAQSAIDAAAGSEAAAAALSAVQDASTDTLDDAKLVASATSGYFAAPLVTALQSQATALETALKTETPDGTTMPDATRPESIADLSAGVAPLTTWATDESARTTEITALTSAITTVADGATAAVLALANTVSAEAKTALDASPLAAADTRSAVEKARDVVLAAVKAEAVLGKPVGEYTAAVAALRTSQQAAVDAAAAAEAAKNAESSSGSGGSGASRLLTEERAHEMCRMFAASRPPDLPGSPWPCTAFGPNGEVWVFYD